MPMIFFTNCAHLFTKNLLHRSICGSNHFLALFQLIEMLILITSFNMRSNWTKKLDRVKHDYVCTDLQNSTYNAVSSS